jgi:hypothetical protein
VAATPPESTCILIHTRRIECLILRAVWAIESHVVAFVESRAVGQSDLMKIHPVTGQLQVLVGTVMDVV